MVLRIDFGEMRDCGVSSYSETVTKNPAAGNQFCLVLIKRRSWLGPVYFLERRSKNDPTFPRRLGIYGGKRETGENRRDAAARELLEETGLKFGAAKLQSLLYFLGDNDSAIPSEGEIFVADWPTFGKGCPTSRSISRYQRSDAAKAIFARNKETVGPPKKVRRWFNRYFWFFDWQKLTPQAAYCLLADWDRDRA